MSRELTERYLANRDRSARLFALIAPRAYYDAPIPLRHPFVFYDGHFPAFSFITLVRDALRKPSLDRLLEDLFNRGIDPASLEAANTHRRTDWPERTEVERFAQACDGAVLGAYAQSERFDVYADEAAIAILEHEEMHHETLLYIVHQLAEEKKIVPSAEHRDAMPTRVEPIVVPTGIATLGASRDEIAFAWDNEFERTETTVPAFGIDKYNVTNGEYRAFVADGGPVPPFWIERAGVWHLLALGETIPLPDSWPVYCSNEQAQAFAHWSGARLMTEPEFHRAAYGTPWGEERPQPWGDDEPSSLYGNFDFRRYDPEPIGSSPRGASAWGVEDLVGNGWEWTSTPFAPLPGFFPMRSYPQYSADFFGGEHRVMKGASPVTSRHLVRASFRNWYRRAYPYAYAAFRRAYD